MCFIPLLKQFGHTLPSLFKIKKLVKKKNFFRGEFFLHRKRKNAKLIIQRIINNKNCTNTIPKTQHDHHMSLY